jgi:hypothetical protein
MDAQAQSTELEKIELPAWYYAHPEGYLWFVLESAKFQDLPESLEVEGQFFQRKDEFHVTIINSRSIARALAEGNSEKEDLIKERLKQLLVEYAVAHPISFSGFTGDLRLAKTGERTSIAARCNMQGLEGYFETVRRVLGINVPTQPAHASLYTVTGRAVGIDSTDEMEAFKKVDVPSVQAILAKL